MTDTTTNFDPARLQRIAAIIKESDADIVYAPTVVAYEIECAIKEIERLRRDYSCICGQMRRMMEERDEARRVQCLLFENMVSVMTTGSPFAPAENARRHAKAKGWDCFDKLDKENTDA